MVAKLNDAMAYVREFGGGDLFSTATCNSLRPEITETIRRLYPGERSPDHPEIVSLVFWLKLRGMLHLLKDGAVFGAVRAYIHLLDRMAEAGPTIRPHRPVAGAG